MDPDTSGGSGDANDHEDDDDRQPLLSASETSGSGETIPTSERRTATWTSYRKDSCPGAAEQAETSFIEDDLNERAWGALTTQFSNARATELETGYSKTGRLQVKMFSFAKKSYFLFTGDRTTGESKLISQLTKEIKAALGPTRNAIMEQSEQEILDLEQRIAEDKETAKDNTLSENVHQTARESVLENFEDLEERM